MIVDMSAPGVEVRPIYDLSGEHHFNEVFLDGAFVPDRSIIGTVGRGWEQVTAQFAFERGGPERFMSVYPLLDAIAEALAVDGSKPGAAEAFGELVGRLRGLRALCWEVGRRMDAGEAPTAEAAMLKFLGTHFEQDVLETARWLSGGGTGRRLDAMVDDVQLSMPGISLRGGSTEILAGIIARHGQGA
jgi:alkylation response protein AidB-like acyl-CoA dehydrogenase